jgi:hypothetical protein
VDTLEPLRLVEPPAGHDSGGRRHPWWVIVLALAVLVSFAAGTWVIQLTVRSRVADDAPVGVSFRTGEPASPEVLARTAQLIDARLAASGVPLATATVENGDIVVRGDVNAATLDSAVRPSTVTFRPVAQVMAPIPAGGPSVTNAQRFPRLADFADNDSYAVGPTKLGVDLVESASAAPGGPGGSWTVRPVFRPGADGIDRFNALAAECAGGPTCATSRVALVVGDQVAAAPLMRETPMMPVPVFERDQVVFSGALPEPVARFIAELINLGPLPVSLEPR